MSSTGALYPRLASPARVAQREYSPGGGTAMGEKEAAATLEGAKQAPEKKDKEEAVPDDSPNGEAARSGTAMNSIRNLK